MRGRDAFAIAILVSVLIYSANAQYWFQFGATGDQVTYHNTGAAVTIQTVTQPYLQNGSIGFWTGENLANGAFIQVGYVIENQSGNYPSYCNQYNCTSTEYINKGDAEWFYEYFLPNSNSNTFMGAIGPDGSAGPDGKFNRYSFYYSNGVWHLLLNGNQIGTVDLGTGSSGNNAPVAFGEMANSTDANTRIMPVIFSNFSFYNSAGDIYPVPHGYSYIGYGVGSDKALQNPYGVSEAGSRINYFEAGSGLPQPNNGYQLWNFGYYLKIISAYGARNSTAQFQAYSSQQISEPKYVYMGNMTRVVFEGWSGTGAGSYSGPDNSTVITISSNITENANWQLQYRINVNSSYGAVKGTGWYNAGSLVNYAVDNTTYYYNKTTRYAFQNWSNGNENPSASTYATSPFNITATFIKEYYVNASSKYGRISGSGWYAAGTNATVSLSNYTVKRSNFSQTSFYSWSNGSSTPYLNFIVTQPVSINAIFRKQYLASFQTADEYGNKVFPSAIYINDKAYGDSAFIFPDQTYNITGVYYDNMKIAMDQPISITSNSTVFVNLPLYNVNATFTDVFGNPINVTIHAIFANGTSENLQANDGRVSFTDLPYGMVNLSTTYDGTTEYASTSDGTQIRQVFVSVYDIGVLIAIVAIAFMIYFMSRSRLHKGM